MKLRIFILAGVLAGTGCGVTATKAATTTRPTTTVAVPVTPDPTSPSTTTYPVTAPALPSATVDKILVDQMHRDYPITLRMPDSDITDVGHLACNALRTGSTISDLMRTIATTLPTADQAWAAAMTGAGVGAYCPELDPS